MEFYDRSLLKLFTLAASFLFLCFPAHGYPPAAADSAPELHFVRGQRAVGIPFEISDKGHIFLRVRTDGSEPLWFGLDSGTEQTLISRQQANKLNLKLQGGMRAAGSGEDTVDFALARNVSFSLSGVDFTLPEVGVLALEFSQAVRGDDATTIGAGIIGGKLLRQFKTVIFDPSRRRMILVPTT